MSARPIGPAGCNESGCSPDTHNLHCGYPDCAKGKADKRKRQPHNMTTHTQASVLAEFPQYPDAQRALNCLYIAVEESVAKDVGTKVHAAFFALTTALAEARNALEAATHAREEAELIVKAARGTMIDAAGHASIAAMSVELSRLRPVVEAAREYMEPWMTYRKRLAAGQVFLIGGRSEKDHERLRDVLLDALAATPPNDAQAERGEG